MEIKVLESMVCCFWVLVIGLFYVYKSYSIWLVMINEIEGKVFFEFKLFIVIMLFYCLIFICINLIVCIYLKYCIMVLGCVNLYFER